MAYPSVDPQPSFPALEAEVLAFWEGDKTFPASVEQRPAGAEGANEYVFYDGPPFANGLPHYGHLLTGFVKDAVPRYQTMRGRRVERRFGWDCHGLPAEVEAEKELGLSGRPEIVDYGIDRFNEACRTSVLRYTNEWERYVTRQARWVDFENDYKTLDLPYMESVMWAFRSLWDKGLVYEGFRVLAYCWRCETPLSNTETRMDDVYKDRQDPALTVWFELERSARRILAWTTTPWTLPSNLALAVGPDIDYAVMEEDGAAVHPGRGPPRRLRTRAGRGHAGRHREGRRAGRSALPAAVPVLRRPTRVTGPGAFQVLAADFVSTEDGTGVVHMSPGHGEEDQAVCNANGIETVVPMDAQGRYTAEVAPWAGMHVFDANPLVIRALKDAGHVVRHETYDHPYPHCWRCAKPLVYRAVSSWFVRSRAFRDRMVELNQEITWVPEHIKRRQLRQVAGQRPRLVDQPQPVLGFAHPGLEERRPPLPARRRLRQPRRAGAGLRCAPGGPPPARWSTSSCGPTRTTRPVSRRCAACPRCSTAGSSPGSMPFAQVHYPFENQDWFEHHYPGDFIVEYIGQTRGWFYTLHVLATALFDRPAFRTCVSHGIVLGDDGQKMSKSLRNYPDPFEMFDTYGADAMRWFLLSSPVLRGGDLVGHRGGHPRRRPPGAAAAVERVVLPLALRQRRGRRRGASAPTRPTCSTGTSWPRPTTSSPSVTASMDAYDLFGACARRPGVPRRADELVHPPQPQPVLDGRAGRHRHAAHRPLGDDPGGGAAPAARDRAHLPGADR